MTDVTFTPSDGWGESPAGGVVRIVFTPRMTPWRNAAGEIVTPVEGHPTEWAVGQAHTVSLDPGPWHIHYAGRALNVVVPVSASPIPLWDLFGLTVALPPGTPESVVRDAVGRWLDEHPPLIGVSSWDDNGDGTITLHFTQTGI